MTPLALVLLAHHLLLLATLGANLVYLRLTRTPRRPAPAVWPRLSVLIPARNEEANLRRLLPALWTQDYPDFEVVVVDDASDDGTWDVLAAQRDDRLRPVRGSGPPPGWVGKVHALYRATRHATGDVFLFLDADALPRSPGSLRRLVHRLLDAGPQAVVSGLPRYTDPPGSLLLTSMVPFTILVGLPMALIPRTRSPLLGMLNGQCWLLHAADYRAHEPHAAHPAEILEDVQIGRTLKRQGLRLHLRDLQPDIAVAMYDGFAAAWQGFRKNAYLLLGGTPWTFLPLLALFLGSFVLAPLVWPPLLGTLYLMKLLVDRHAHFPLWLTLLNPLTQAASVALQLDSAVAHWTGRVSWKGRKV